MITVAILTLSDKGSKGEREDISGRTIQKILEPLGFLIKYYDILPDEKDQIKEKLLSYINNVDLILTTGGTGLSPRDVTPDVTAEIIEKEIPGISEAMRIEGLKKTKRAMLSRAIAGIKGQTLIINLPGSPKGVEESLTAILEAIPHAIEKIKGDLSECGR